MRSPAVVGITLLVLSGSASTAEAQPRPVTTRWFDINPSRSNLDDEDPNGASGGRVNHVGAAADMSRVYAATEWGGLYQSFDQGNTWVRVQTFAPSATWDVKVDPANAARVYVTSFFDGRTTPRSGISVSNDAGATWTTVNIPALNTLTCTTLRAAQEPAGWQISVNATTPRWVFAGTSCGLARSLDSGATWTFHDPSPGNNAEQVFSVVAHGNQIVDVISGNGYFRSTDNGGTWSPAIAAPGPVAGVVGPGTTLAVSPAENYVLLAANTQNPPGPPVAGINIWESQNGGQTWPTSLTPPTLNGQSIAQGRIPFVKTNQLRTSTQFDVWFGDTNLFKATAITPSTLGQGGAQRTPQNSWTLVQDDGHWDVGDVLFDPRFTSGACPRVFSNDGGVYVNTDVNDPDCQTPNWEQPQITPHATWLFGFDGVRLSQGLHALTYGLQDNGGYAASLALEGNNAPIPNWNNYFCCDVLHNSEGAGRVISLDGSFGGGRAFRLFLRDTGGGGGGEIPNYPTPAAFTRGESGRQNVPFGNTGLVVNVTDGAGAAAGSTGDVYFTNNFTANPIVWTSLNSPAAANSGTGSLKIANLGGRPNVFYHTGNGNPEVPGSVFRSTLVGTTGAPGANWTAMTLPPGVTAVTAYDIDPTNGNRVIISGINAASNNFEIWMTQNFGVGGNWVRLNNLENLMLGVTAAGSTFVNQATQGKNTGTFNFGTLWQPSLFKFNPLDSTTIVAGAIDAGVFLSLDDGANWQLVSNPTNPTSTSPHIPRPLFAYFSPGRFASDTTSFDVWVGTRGAGVVKAVIER
jgi:hypothetical protein